MHGGQPTQSVPGAHSTDPPRSPPPRLVTATPQHKAPPANLQANRGPSRTNKEHAHDEELNKALWTGTGREAQRRTKSGR